MTFGISSSGGGENKDKIYLCSHSTLACRLLLCALVPLLCPEQALAFAVTDVSGNVGYTYRSLKKNHDEDTVSNQVQGAVNIKSFLWRPWFATADVGLRFTRDQSDFGNASSTKSTFLTGDLNLSVLGQSRTPFTLSYLVSDSQVDLVTRDSPLTTLGSGEFSTSRLALKQSYITEKGNRFQLRYDNNSWSENGGEDYDDNLVGLEMDFRMPRHRLIAKTSYQTTHRSRLDQKTDTAILNVDHFFHPSRALRVDTMVSLFNSDNRSKQPLNSTNQGDSRSNLAQLSSFVFYRPPDRPLTVSGGIRLYDLGGESANNNTSLRNYSATGGLFYQLNKNLRLDARLDATVNETGSEQNTATREQAGALYQSDIHELLSSLTYQWYSQANAHNRNTRLSDTRGALLKLGHDLQRLWVLGGKGNNSNLRLSFNQAVSDDEQGGDLSSSVQRLDNSGSLSWDLVDGAGTTFFQLTLSDVHSYGDLETDQQFANFQAQRSQTLSRRSNLTGNITIQYLNQGFNDSGDNARVTSTGQINYTHSAVFGVPRLRFLSDVRIARTDVADNVDRTEWENRFDYVIGLLDTRLSWRYFRLQGETSGKDSGSQDSSLLYFQVIRRF